VTSLSLSPSSSSSSVCLSPPLSVCSCVHSREDGMSRRGVRTTLNHCRQVTAPSPRPSPRQSPVPKTNPAVSVFPVAASPQSFHAGHAAYCTHTLIGQRLVLTGHRPALIGHRSVLIGHRPVLIGRRPVLIGQRAVLGAGKTCSKRQRPALTCQREVLPRQRCL